jgi:hypothetical protein
MNTDKQNAFFFNVLSVFIGVHRWPFLFFLEPMVHDILGALRERYRIVWWRYFTFAIREFSIVTTPPKQRSMLC